MEQIVTKFLSYISLETRSRSTVNTDYYWKNIICCIVCYLRTTMCLLYPSRNFCWQIFYTKTKQQKIGKLFTLHTKILNRQTVEIIIIYNSNYNKFMILCYSKICSAILYDHVNLNSLLMYQRVLCIIYDFNLSITVLSKKV